MITSQSMGSALRNYLIIINNYSIIIVMLFMNSLPSQVYMWCSVAVVIFLIIIVIFYFLRWQRRSIPILQVLVILLINEIFQSTFEALSYVNESDSLLCKISLIGRLGFTVAANVWIIFITRLVYLEALAPGKYFNIVNFVLRNVVLAYVPSLVISIFLVVILNIESTKGVSNCWRVISEGEIMDYVIYSTCFLLPHALSAIIILIYLCLYSRIPTRKWTIFLLFPITALTFNLYSLIIRVFSLVSRQRVSAQQIPLAFEHFVYGILFIYIYKNQKPTRACSSDFTISDISASFIDDI